MDVRAFVHLQRIYYASNALTSNTRECSKCTILCTYYAHLLRAVLSYLRTIRYYYVVLCNHVTLTIRAGYDDCWGGTVFFFFFF